jgi:hypothetical protein
MKPAIAAGALGLAAAVAGCTDPYTSTPAQIPATRRADATALESAARRAARRPVNPDLATPGTRSMVEAVNDRDGSGDHRRLIVVTREATRYRVTLATAQRDGSRWKITRWEPQP